MAIFEKKIVGVRVDVDESGRNDQSFDIDNPFGFAIRKAAYGNELVPRDGHISVKPRIATSINDASIANNEVILRVRSRKREGEQTNQCRGCNRAEEECVFQ